MGLRPDFRIVANDQDITSLIDERFVSLKLTDATGLESDELEVVLSDHDPAHPIKMLPTGAELQLALGYDGKLREMGLYICDEVMLSGWPSMMTIRARAAPQDKTSKGKQDLQTQKTRAWKDGTTISAMVGQMAREHGLTPKVAASLGSIKLPHFYQSSESDINLLLRVAKRYDAIVKPGGGCLAFVKRGDSQSASGSALPQITLDPSDVTSWSMTRATRNSPGTVVAAYYSYANARRHEITIGDGDPVRELRIHFKSQEEALSAARAEQSARARGETTLWASLAGRPDLTAEATLNLSGWRDGVPTAWLINRVEHTMGKDGPYTCTIEAQLPNSDSSVQAATAGAPRERVMQPSS